MKRYSILLVVLLLCVAITNAQQSRIALVIGNANYQNGGDLTNPVNDANLMETTLQDLGFEVTKLTNASLKQMNTAALNFTREITNYDVALFYYAGHGIEVEGTNYLVPVDASLNDKYAVSYDAFEISKINDAFSRNSNNMNIMILDACRDDPFRSWQRGGDRGFVAIGNQTAGTIIAFATREGETASDGIGTNGLYTQELVKQMKISQDINSVFKNTRVAVLSASKKKQCPQEWDMTTGSFYFKKNSNPDVVPVFVPGDVEYGSISINTEITGDLYVDNKKIGTLQANSNNNKLNQITIGSHIVEIKGNQNFKQTVIVSENSTTYVDAKSTSPRDIPQSMVLIHAGTFTMGSPKSEVDRDSDETQHQVTINYDFLMGKYEVTQAEYEALTGNNPSNFSSCDNCPVERVTWWDAIKYCNALSRKEGFSVAYNENTGDLLDANGNVTIDITKVVGYRLPTEAEWEYAARAGNTMPFSTGSNLTTSQANYNGNYPYNGNIKGIYREKTIAVGSFSPNNWGLYDMHGNVWEWCYDWKANYIGNVINPIGADSGDYRVLRGGSWNYRERDCRSAYRYDFSPSAGYGYVGFRLCRVL